jgi:DNA invertase Pin-like site-specific DNA recombinase
VWRCGWARSPAGECDIVLAESLDRFSRDQEHVAGFYKQLAFVGVRIFTVNYGESR